MDRKKYVQQQRDYHAAIVAKHVFIVEALNAELAKMEEETAEGSEEGHKIRLRLRVGKGVGYD